MTTNPLLTLEALGRSVWHPGSTLQQVAERYGLHRICLGLSSIGGRYSALSDFGMVPAVAMGLDVRRFLDRADEMVHRCAACVPVADNPGVALGAVLGTLGAHDQSSARDPEHVSRRDVVSRDEVVRRAVRAND